MWSWLDFFAVVFAAGAIIEVWHKGTIFATARAYVQAWQDAVDSDSLRGKFFELLTCPFCQSYHVPIYLFLLLWLSTNLGPLAENLTRTIVYGLAATRIGNVLNSVLPPTARYKDI
jgi:hypothetical protein